MKDYWIHFTPYIKFLTPKKPSLLLRLILKLAGWSWSYEDCGLPPDTVMRVKSRDNRPIDTSIGEIIINQKEHR